MSRTENVDPRECGLPAETDALATYLDALMRPVPGAVACAPAPGPASFRQPTEPFSCLPIVVGGMTLALPGGDVREVLGTPLHPQAVAARGRLPAWFAGYCDAANGRATLVDLATVISDGARSSGRAKAAVVVGDGRYALACDAVGDTFDMQPALVRWRTPRTRRPWLAGIEATRRCALLDIRALARQLAADEAALA